MILQKWSIAIPLLWLILLVSANAQDYPDTLWVKVTFYDFHADGSNPEFEPKNLNNRSGLYTGMVADTLTADKKPILGNSPFFNYNINKWFRPWSAGDFTIPDYIDQATRTIDTVNYDTAFKNLVFTDSLPFIHTGNGMYSFERSGKNGTDEFFWLDGKGFGNEPMGKNHNFSFTMELHTTFTFKKGMKFDFIGDDDVWAFINGKLAMDLGGIHSSQVGSISLDDIAQTYNMTEGNKYPFDFFYVERHINNSTIKVMTNLFTPDSKIRLYEKSSTPDANGNPAISGQYSIPAGESVNIYARVFDSTAWHPEWDSLVTWEISDVNGVISSGNSKNGEITIPACKAYTNLVLTVKFINPNDPTHKVNVTTMNLFVGPGKPYQVTFQETNDTIKLDSSPLKSLSISEQQSNATLYAVVRDSEGYFIRFANQASWESSDKSVVTVSASSENKAKGTITKANRGTTQVKASESGLKPAVIDVNTSVVYIKLSSAITADRDGDGYLDMITLRFDSPLSIDVQAFKSVMHVSCNGTDFTVDSIRSANGNSNSSDYRVYIHEEITTDFETSWTPVISIAQNNDIVAVSNFKCTDGAGPVIGRAFYYPGSFESGSKSSGTPDTIFVTLSEKVKKPSDNDPDLSFAYYHNGKIEQNAFSSFAAFDDSTAKLIVNNGFPIESIKDSLQLVSSDEMVDLLSNKAQNNSRKTFIEWGDFRIVYGPSSNPVKSGEKIPSNIAQVYEQVIKAQIETNSSIQSAEGVIVGISIKGKPLVELSDGSCGKGIIYDALGNLIRSDLKVTKVNGNKYGIYWDCRNKGHRFVGVGTYVLRFTVSDVSGRSTQNQLKIGVKGSSE